MAKIVPPKNRMEAKSPEPKAAIPLDELREPIQPNVPVPLWRWIVAALLAPVIFLLAQLPLVFFGQIFNDIPDRWAFVPLIAEVAIGLAGGRKEGRGTLLLSRKAGVSPFHVPEKAKKTGRSRLRPFRRSRGQIGTFLNSIADVALDG